MFGKTDVDLYKSVNKTIKKSKKVSSKYVKAWRDPKYKKKLYKTQLRQICKRCATPIKRHFIYCYYCYRKNRK